MKRTTMAHSSQDHSPLHTFMLSREIGQSLWKISPWVVLSSFLGFSSQNIAEQTWFIHARKVSEWPLVNIGLTFFSLIGLPTVRSPHPLKDGALLLYFYPFSGYRILPTKNIPINSSSCFQTLLKWKHKSSIYFLGLTKNQRDCTTRSLWHHPIDRVCRIPTLGHLCS